MLSVFASEGKRSSRGYRSSAGYSADVIAFKTTYSNRPSRPIFPNAPLISQIASMIVLPLIMDSAVTLESSDCVVVNVLFTVIPSFTRPASFCSIPRCVKKLSRNCLRVIGNVNPSYQLFTSALIMSYMASYAVIWRFVRSAVGVSDCTVYVPYSNGSSSFPSRVSVTRNFIPFVAIGTSRPVKEI